MRELGSDADEVLVKRKENPQQRWPERRKPSSKHLFTDGRLCPSVILSATEEVMPFKSLTLGLTLMALMQFRSSGYAQAPSSMLGMVDQKSSVYSFTVGDAQIAALSDGSVPQDLHTLLHRTTNGELMLY